MRLTDEQIELYSRQIILREVGGTGQAALRTARVRVLGAGAAAEACTSYLVGAGIGVVALDDAVLGHDDATRVLPLPDPRRRTPDASLAGSSPRRESSGAGEHDDVLLDLDPTASSLPSTACPRLGSILLRADADDGLHLLLLPRDAGCPACTRAAAEPGGDARHPAPLASASAGALAALTCCRWILGIGHDTAVRALVLPAGSGIWTDDVPPVRIVCPGGCPQPTQPV